MEHQAHYEANPQYFGVRDTAAYFRVHPNTIYKLLRMGLPHTRVGGQYRIGIPEATAWLREATR